MTTTKKKVKSFRSKRGRKTTISDLPEDLVRDILSRVPLIYLTAVRATCKTWNEISKNLVLGQKAAKKQFLAFMVVGCHSVRSLRFELQGIRNDGYDYEYEDQYLDYPSIKRISIPNFQVEISKVCHCDGLLLCVTKYNSSRLLVWNPYLGKTRLIQPINKFDKFLEKFALGYNNNRNHKVIRFCNAQDRFRNALEFIDEGSNKKTEIIDEGSKEKTEIIDVYDFSSDSWRAVLNLDWDMVCYGAGVSLKGNAYFCCRKVNETDEHYLICFDFTRERFGPLLPLPLNPYQRPHEGVTLSWHIDDKLALLYNNKKNQSLMKANYTNFDDWSEKAKMGV